MFQVEIQTWLLANSSLQIFLEVLLLSWDTTDIYHLDNISTWSVHYHTEPTFKGNTSWLGITLHSSKNAFPMLS